MIANVSGNGDGDAAWKDFAIGDDVEKRMYEHSDDDVVGMANAIDGGVAQKRRAMKIVDDGVAEIVFSNDDDDERTLNEKRIVNDYADVVNGFSVRLSIVHVKPKSDMICDHDSHLPADSGLLASAVLDDEYPNQHNPPCPYSSSGQVLYHCYAPNALVGTEVEEIYLFYHHHHHHY